MKTEGKVYCGKHCPLFLQCDAPKEYKWLDYHPWNAKAEDCPLIKAINATATIENKGAP